MLLSFWHLGSFLGALTLIRNGSVLVRQVSEPKHPTAPLSVQCKCFLFEKRWEQKLSGLIPLGA